MTDVVVTPGPSFGLASLTVPDVSEWQGDIDWVALGKAAPAVIVRALYGTTHVDTKWTQNLAGSRANTQWRAFYAYLDQASDPVAAAKKFMSVVGPLQPGEGVILDLEEGSGDQRPRRQAWLDTVTGGAFEWTYSGLWFARQHLPGVAVDWLAAYGQGEPTDAHRLWQFTDKQSFPGIASPCDASVFHGDVATLIAITGGRPAPTPTPVQPQPVNHNTGLNTERPWGAFPLPATDWYGVNDGSAHSHSGLQSGDQRAVKQIQREVGVPDDGNFGKIQTLPAVVHFQTRNGLLGDGRVGPKTWGVMTRV